MEEEEEEGMEVPKEVVEVLKNAQVNTLVEYMCFVSNFGSC